MEIKKTYNIQEIEGLKKIMEMKNYSIEDISKILDVSFNTVFRWIDGQYNPSRLALKELRKFIKRHEQLTERKSVIKLN